MVIVSLFSNRNLTKTLGIGRVPLTYECFVMVYTKRAIDKILATHNEVIASKQSQWPEGIGRKVRREFLCWSTMCGKAWVTCSAYTDSYNLHNNPLRWGLETKHYKRQSRKLQEPTGSFRPSHQKHKLSGYTVQRYVLYLRVKQWTSL